LNSKKCHFAKSELKFLGYVINEDCISTNLKKKEHSIYLDLRSQDDISKIVLGAILAQKDPQEREQMIYYAVEL
ncbi:740_t:CDS:2, partial [Racocetra persica]